ncbi:hypothetical protein Alg130_12023, partial [Pyrenophora tritici-repentis]
LALSPPPVFSPPPSSPPQSSSTHGCATLCIPKPTLKPSFCTRARPSDADAPWHTAPPNGPASTATSPLRPPKA